LSSAPPSTLLLDLGKVLVDFDFTRFGRRIALLTGLDVEAVRAALGAEDLPARYECGFVSDADFHGEVCRRMAKQVPWGEFSEAWNSIFHAEPMVPAELVADLARRADLWLVSNTNRIHFEFLRRRFPMLGCFRGYILSHEIGAMKPDARIFAEALCRSGALPDDALFVDDQEANVAAARALGIAAFRFVDGEQFEAELRLRKLL
jgi:putative hydrolase of the HAD superfamily